MAIFLLQQINYNLQINPMKYLIHVLEINKAKGKDWM